MVNGPRANQVNLVFISEGYISDELAEFPNHASAMLDQLLLMDPFNPYRSYFNAYAIGVASAESGSDHPSKGVFRDTCFNSSFDSYGLARGLTVPPNGFDPDPEHGFGKARRLLAEVLPEWSVIIFVVNDYGYGGWGDADGVVVSRSWFAPQILIHEIGHTLGGLGDEYDLAFPDDPYPVVEEPNTTQETRRDRVKWRAWISESTLIPTPSQEQYGTLIGLFEGARYTASGWYRPKLHCIMRESYFDFCEVCREALILAIYRFVSPIQSASPPDSTIQLRDDEQIELRVEPKEPQDHPLLIEWSVDGTLLDNSTRSFLVQAAVLGNGEHHVEARIVDETDKVRTDPAGLLGDIKRWTVQIGAPVEGPSRSGSRPEHPTRLRRRN